MKKKWIWAVAAAGVILLAMLASAPPTQRSVPPSEISRKLIPNQTIPPGTPARGTDVEAPEKSVVPSPNKPDTEARLNSRVINAAESVDGVRKAWAVVTTPTGATKTGVSKTQIAVVGVELESSLKGKAAQSTLDEVAASVKEVPDIDRVAVTASPTLVERIRRTAEAIQTGKAPAIYTTDMRHITAELVPRAR